ncbi:MAG: TonB family protein [Desulfuromonadaceae bacterium]
MKNLTINQAAFGTALLFHATLLLIPAWKSALLSEASERIEFRFISPAKADIAEPREVQSKPAAPAQELKQQRPIEQAKQVVSSAPSAPVPAQTSPPAAVKAAADLPPQAALAETLVGTAVPEAPPQQMTSRVADGQGSGSTAPRKESADSGRSSRLGEYLAQVRAKVETNKEYPSSARQMGYQGTVTVRVTIKVNGNIDTVAVVASSGHKNLDKAALSAVRNAAPFKSSAGYGLADVTMEIPIVYRLN